MSTPLQTEAGVWPPAAATLGALIATQAERLRATDVALGQGTLRHEDEAAWLVLHALQRPFDALDALDTPVTSAEAAAAEALITRRIDERLPAAYLTGEAWLQGVPFHIDARSIVPRSLIAEVLAAGTLDDLLGREPEAVLDLCTGNGSLGVLCALAWPECRVDAADLSAEALAVAERNRQRHGVAARLQLLQGDGLAPVAGRRYDLIVCNPPYVNAASMAALPPEFRAEPALALAGGADGMDFVRALLPAARQHLHADGWLVLEIGHERAHFEAAFQPQLPTLNPLWLATEATDDQVLALSAAALSAARWGVSPHNPEPPC